MRWLAFRNFASFEIGSEASISYRESENITNQNCSLENQSPDLNYSSSSLCGASSLSPSILTLILSAPFIWH